jgi:ABC-2 type transport system ATP-binding protein
MTRLAIASLSVALLACSADPERRPGGRGVGAQDRVSQAAVFVKCLTPPSESAALKARTSSMLEACHLTKFFSGVAAVKDVSFGVHPGQILGYLGPNGSGKTTTVNLLLGLLEPTEGSVLFHGRDIQEDLVGYRRHVGYVPEEPNLYSYLSGREYLELVGRLRGLTGPLLAKKIPTLLELFGLAQDMDKDIGSYSKGMKQKVLISAALLHDPELLIFDEPLSGLDATTALVFRSLVRTLADRGKTILYSSHALEVVEKLCSKVIVLYHGHVVAHDSVSRLRDLMARDSLEGVFAELVFREDPERIGRDIADAAALTR